MALPDFDLNLLPEPLMAWYALHARALPWREDVTPYRVWVSEVMLQQTRAEAVKPYFTRFVEELPSVKELSECEEDRLLKLWEGLGYYNRVRNMQRAARVVMADHGGSLPSDFETLLSLPGIGRYTAGAIASIAFNLPVPAVDGNVLRILMRVSADDSDIAGAPVRAAAERRIASVIPEGRASVFNQALMELGATVCLPGGDPLCGGCPWNTFCEARRQDKISQLPVKKKPKGRRIEDRTVLLIRDDDRIVLHKRPADGLLAGMYEFPNRSGHLTQDEAVRTVSKMGLRPLHISELGEAKHIFSHVEWHMTGYMIRVDSLTRDESEQLFVKLEEVRDKYPIPAAFAAYTESLWS